MSAERDTAVALPGSVQWLEQRMNELLAEHERTCVARINELEGAMHTAGEQVMTLTKENDAVRADLSQALAERDQESENAARMAEEIADWQEASGLLSGGDPGGVTPELLREHQGMASDIIGAAARFMEARGDDNESFLALKTAIATYLERWPEQ